MNSKGNPSSGWIGALIWLVCLPALAADRGDTLADRAGVEINQPAQLTVLWVASPGWAEPGPDGQPKGAVIDIMNRFAGWLDHTQRIPVELVFEQETNWGRFYGRVRDGQGGLFGLGNVTITPARADELAFSPPYVNNVAVLISHRGFPELHHAEELPRVFAGQRAMAFADTLHEQRLDSLAELAWPEMPVDRTGSNEDILAAAAAGSHFGYIDGYHFFRAVDEGLPLKRHSAFDDPGEQFGIIMPLENDWQALLTEFFSADGGLKASDWYREALAEHLGPDVARMLLR